MRLTAPRAAVAAVATAFAVALSAPAVAYAEPADPTTTGEQTPEVDERVLDSLGSFAPALIGSLTTRGADGELNQDLLATARTMAENPALPAEVTEVWSSLIDFIAAPDAESVPAAAQPRPAAEATEDADLEIPQGPGAPVIQQFLYPTVGLGCIPGGIGSVGMALTTAGPQEAPAPGPKPGEAGFVYTSLGTGPALDNAQRSLWVAWVNLETGATGTDQLKPNPRINADEGPATFTTISKTGKGRIVSTIYGDVTSTTNDQRASCTIVPTVGTAII